MRDEENLDIGGSAPQAYRNVNKALRDRFKRNFGFDPGVPDGSSPRRDFFNLLSKFDEFETRGKGDSHSVLSEIIENNELHGDEALLVAQTLQNDPAAPNDRQELLFNVDDFPPNVVKGHILDALTEHLEASSAPVPLSKVFRYVFTHLGDGNARVGRNRHAFPMFRWLREPEHSQIRRTGKILYISRATGGRVQEFPDSPEGLVLRFGVL